MSLDLVRNRRMGPSAHLGIVQGYQRVRRYRDWQCGWVKQPKVAGVGAVQCPLVEHVDNVAKKRAGFHRGGEIVAGHPLLELRLVLP